MKDAIFVGQLPQKFLLFFVRKGGGISRRITDIMHYSSGLAQGGLEVPFLLIFVGDIKYSEKAEKFVKSDLQTNNAWVGDSPCLTSGQ